MGLPGGQGVVLSVALDNGLASWSLGFGLIQGQSEQHGVRYHLDWVFTCGDYGITRGSQGPIHYRVSIRQI
jgi:hypothetical protein